MNPERFVMFQLGMLIQTYDPTRTVYSWPQRYRRGCSVKGKESRIIGDKQPPLLEALPLLGIFTSSVER